MGRNTGAKTRGITAEEVRANQLRVALADALRPLEKAEDIQRQAAELIAGHFHVARVNFASLSPEGDYLIVEQEYAPGLPSVVGQHPAANYRKMLADGVGRTWAVENTAEDPELSESEKKGFLHYGYASILVIKLITKGRIAGFLTAADTRPRSWSVAEVKLMDEAAERVWTAIERAAAEAALRRSEERYRLVGRATNDVIADWDIRADILEWNEATLTVLGYRPEELRLPSDYLSHVHTDDLERVVETLNEAVARGRALQSFEYRFRKPDGTYLTLLARSYIAYGPSGEPERAVTSLLDLTESRRVEQALSAANAQLIENDRRKNEFLAMLAHELRNPLAVISNTVQLLKAIVSQPANRYIDMLQRQIGMLAGMIDDLLDVSRITRGAIALRKKPVNITAVAEQAFESASPLLTDNRLTTHLNLPRRPVTVLGDPVRLEQVMLNLLTNAAKYTDPGGEVTFSLDAHDDCAEVRVQDTGIGIAPETQSFIFELFGQAERSLDRSQGGLGIGLTIAKNIVELHGGQIEVRSAGVGKGAEFIVRLPVAPAEQSTGSALPAVAADGPRSKRILVVEDNPDVAETMTLLLEEAGHKTATVNNGADALKKAMAFGPEVVLLDIGLPGMNGYEVAKQLRQNPHTQHAALAALTGYGQESDREQSKVAGFDAHFVKPVDFAALTAFIDNAGTGRRSSQPSR